MSTTKDLVIYVDSREKIDQFNRLVLDHPDIEFVRTKLDSGDYSSIRDFDVRVDEYAHVLIERKTLPDLDGSIFDKRLATQFDRIAAKMGYIYVLLIVGNLEDYVEKTKHQPYRPDASAKMLLSIAAKVSSSYGSHVFWFENETTAMDVTVNFIKHVYNGEYNVPLKRDANNLLARFVGVNVNQWKMLLYKYKTLINIANAKAKDLEFVPGIGPVKSQRIIDILNEEL